jgi:hypothetical protein
MNEFQEQFNFLNAAVKLQRMDGKRVITRKELVRKILAVNPQSTYGTNTPFGANFTKHLRTIAKQTGGNYVKDTNGKNARIEF